jgi:hypothetical protein
MSFIINGVTPQVPSIPMPTEDPASLRAAILALKQVVEAMAGTTTVDPQPNMFVSNKQPTARKKGDFWITEYPSITLSYWNGSTWVLLATAP